MSATDLALPAVQESPIPFVRLDNADPALFDTPAALASLRTCQ